MPRKKSKILYIDTNVILDFCVDKDNNVIVLMKAVKSRGWKLRISTFAWVELAEYRRNEIYLWDKLSRNKSLNSIMKRIRNPRDNKKLGTYHFEQVAEWLDEIQKQLPNLDFLDLEPRKKKDEMSGWDIASFLSINSNLNAKDVIHLSTALAAYLNDECDFFITSDGDLYKESTKILDDIKGKLTVIKPKDFIEKYPPIKKR